MLPEDQANAKTCTIAIDYMSAYFDFMMPKDDGFQKARAIVDKYKDKNVDKFNFKESFEKLEQQLHEFDEDVNFNAMDKKKTRKQNVDSRIKTIHEVEVDEQTGALTIESSNIPRFDVKYYLIDAEIIFSSSPFVQNAMEKFTYVKPFTQLSANAKRGQNQSTAVELPETIKNRNVVIEVSGGGNQKFVEFYTCDLKVHIEELIGELRVYQKSTMKVLSRVYVKVFVKMVDGT